MTIKLPEPVRLGVNLREDDIRPIGYTHAQLVQAVKDALEEAISILHGIDTQEQEHPDGWWETSTGAEFDAAKIDAIRAMKEDIQ